MSYNFFFGRQEKPKIKPFIFEKENVLQVIVPWGRQDRLEERANFLFDAFTIAFDEDVTRVKGEAPKPETPRERLESALKAVNLEIHSENPPLINEKEAYEWFVVVKTKGTWTWALSGHFGLKCGAYEVNTLNGAILGSKVGSSIPLDVIGIENSCFVQSGVSASEKKSPFLVVQAEGQKVFSKESFLELKEEIHERLTQSSFWILEILELPETR